LPSHAPYFGCTRNSATLRRGSWQHLLRTKSVTTCKQEIPKSSPPKAAPKPTYSHMVRVTPQARDPGKVLADLLRVQAHDQAHDPAYDQACDISHDKSTPSGSCDLGTCDHGNQSHDLPRDWSSIQSRDHTRLCGQTHFCHAPSPLISTWKTVGTINGVSNSQPSHKTSLCSTMTQMRSTKTHPCTISGLALKYGPPM